MHPLVPALVLLALPPVAFSPEGVDRIAADALRRWRVPGLAVVVVRADRVAVLKGYGTRRAGADDPVTADTLFPVASCTKAFTTALLAALADDGAVGWDDPVAKHLPSFHLSDPTADKLLTVRDLVTHRTGVADHDLLWYRAPWDLDETLRRFGKLPLSAPFRDRFQYNSIPFVAAGRVAAAAGRKPWEQLVRDRLTGPLGMTSVAFTDAEAARAADRAAGHRRGKDGGPEPMEPMPAREPNPAGSISATARDLGAWVRFQLNGGAVAGRRLVSEANLRETHAPQVVQRMTPQTRAVYPRSKQVSYGMGWVVYDYRGELVVAHGGMADGFRAQVTLLPEHGVGFALLNNLHDTRMNVAVSNALTDLALGLPPVDWDGHYLNLEAEERAAKERARAERDRSRTGARPSLPPAGYAGEYADDAYGTGRVTVADGRLVWEWSSFRCPLEPFDGDWFRVTAGRFEDTLIGFDVRDGKPTAVAALGVTFRRK